MTWDYLPGFKGAQGRISYPGFYIGFKHFCIKFGPAWSGKPIPRILYIHRFH